MCIPDDNGAASSPPPSSSSSSPSTTHTMTSKQRHDQNVAKLLNSTYDVIAHELRPFVELAVPTMLLQVGFVVGPFWIASHVGRNFGSTYLSGYALANLTGNLCTLSLLAGLYSASDTLSPQAFGAGNYKEVGLLAMRGFFGSMVILVAVNIVLIPNMQSLLTYIGEDPDAVVYAVQWYRVYAISLPFYSFYNAIWKFLSAQNIMMPLLYACLASCLVVLPLSLEVFTKWFGFIGSAYAFVAMQISQAFLVLVYVWWKQPHVAATWPGLRCWREAMDYNRVVEYLTLGAGGMLAQSEWLYWESLSLIIGRLGVVPLSVHTIPTQIIMATFMCPFGIGTALSIRMGISMPVNVSRTKLLVTITLALSTLSFIATSLLMYIFREDLFSVFTTEDEVIDGADAIWWKVCVYNILVSFFATSVGVAIGLGMQWTLGVVNMFFLWIVGLPITYYTTIHLGQGLNAAWTWIIAPYFAIDVALVIAFIMKDWDAFSLKVREREGVVDDDKSNNGNGSNEIENTATESTHLLSA
mmetsp:Transcript_15012/g.42402  ORF Transcript_15012/g.42402 Transcript_15012/m.42402 type:complete len:526 (-) Transcript_15012:62-1639(-)